MHELTQEEIDIVGGGSAAEVALYAGLAIVGIGIGVAALPITGGLLAGGAIATSGAGLAVLGAVGLRRAS